MDLLHTLCTLVEYFVCFVKHLRPCLFNLRDCVDFMILSDIVFALRRLLAHQLLDLTQFIRDARLHI